MQQHPSFNEFFSTGCHLFNGINLANMFNFKKKFLFLCQPVWLLTGVKAPVLPISPRSVALSAMPQAKSHLQTWVSSLMKSTVGGSFQKAKQRLHHGGRTGSPRVSLFPLGPLLSVLSGSCRNSFLIVTWVFSTGTVPFIFFQSWQGHFSLNSAFHAFYTSSYGERMVLVTEGRAAINNQGQLSRS